MTFSLYDNKFEWVEDFETKEDAEKYAYKNGMEGVCIYRTDFENM